MKFGKELKDNSVPGWAEYYVPYKKLKRIMKRIQFAKEKAQKEQDALKASKAQDNVSLNATENQPLLQKNLQEEQGANKEFWQTLNESITKVNQFYFEQMRELSDRVTKLQIAFFEATTPSGHVHSRPIHVKSVDFDRGFAGVQELYDALVDMRTFANLNFQGFRKIVKKYDKYLDANETGGFLEMLKGQHFYNATDIASKEEILFTLVSKDKLEEGNIQNRLNRKQKENGIMKKVKVVPFAISWGAFFVVLALPTFWGTPIEHRCFALCVLVISLWVTEAIPYFATALLIPPITVMLKIISNPDDPERPLPSGKVGPKLLSLMFNHTSVLILGGYTIAASFSKCGIELYIAATLQKAFGHSPKLFLLAVMYMGLFLSMWISNHTAPVLCVSVLLPIIRDFTTDSRYAKSLLLGLAFACNFGGMMTPVSSMQDALGMQNLQAAHQEISFGQWMCVSVPMCTLGTFLCWLFILAVMDPSDAKTIPPIIYKQEGVTKAHIVVVFLSLMTIGLWATFQFTEEFFGDLGNIALIFMALMFGTGMLSQFDFNSFSWHLLFLLGGGNVLGEAIQSSGLLATVSNNIVSSLPVHSTWLLSLCLSLFVLSLTTFVSHTVGAIILLPICTRVAVACASPHIPVLCATFTISAAMALPFSSFPNVNSLLVEDDNGKPYLTVSDFIKVGIPFSLITTALIATVGYGLVLVAT